MKLTPIDFKAIIYNHLENKTRDLATVLSLENKDKEVIFKYVRNTKKKDPLIQVNILSDDGKLEVFDLRIAPVIPKYIGIAVTYKKSVTILKFQIFSKKLKNILLSYRNQSDKNALWKKYIIQRIFSK